MQIIELLPHGYCKGHFLKINSIAVRWEGKFWPLSLCFMLQEIELRQR